MTDDTKRLRVGLFGTFEIDNYGDLLFPIIFKKALGAHLAELEVRLFSPGPGTFRFDGSKIHSARELERLHEDLEAFVVGGGDIVRFDTPPPYSRNQGFDFPPYLCLWLLPALYAASTGKPLLWNAPGVPYPLTQKQSDIASEVLRLADYVAVRDDTSKERLRGNATSVTVVPDTAFLISRLFPKGQLSQAYDLLKAKCDLEEPYLAFQISRAGLDSAGAFAEALSTIAREHNARIVLLPLGPVHGDIEALEAVKKRSPSDVRFVREDLHPLEMTAIISHARWFAGTSLHGNIASFAYGIPGVAVNDLGLSKLEHFGTLTGRPVLASWDDPLETLRGLCGRDRVGPEEAETLKGISSAVETHFKRLAEALQHSRDTKTPKTNALIRMVGTSLRDLDQRELLRSERAAQERLVSELRMHLLVIHGMVGWKVLERLRALRDRLFPPGRSRRNLYWTARRGVEILLDEGPRAFLWKASQKIRRGLGGQGLWVHAPLEGVPPNTNEQYEMWVRKHRLTPHAVRKMSAVVETFGYRPLISIITAVYDTREGWLRKAIDSVRAQRYLHWELCLVNDASTKPRVQAVLDEYAALDGRIKVKHLLQNEGATGAGNHALGMSTGGFVGSLDSHDELSPDAFFEVVKRLNEHPDLDLLYSDEDRLELDGRRVEPFFKPDWSPDLLLSCNYLGHFGVFRRSPLIEIGGFRTEFVRSADYDLYLRFTERTDKIAHIPKILYHWRKVPASVTASPSARPAVPDMARRALEEALRRRGHEGWVEGSSAPGKYTVRYRPVETPLVSIIIPTRDQWQLLQQCIRSVEERTSYPRYEIIVLDNDSAEPQTLKYLEAIERRWRVYRYAAPFNFSAINNFGAALAMGEHLLFLNDDTQVIRPDWLTAMLEHAQRPEVGAVGAKLLYPDGRVQHAGTVLGIGGLAGHAFRYVPGDALSHLGFADCIRNSSAVTAACMMVPRRVFTEVGGFDERFKVAFNDVDFCLRLRERGYLIVYTPLAVLYHHESATRGRVHPPEDEALCLKRWGDVIRSGDPYYNANLTLSREDWSL